MIEAATEVHEAARRRAESAAELAGVTVRMPHELPELEQIAALCNKVWRPDPTMPVVTVEWLRVLAHVDNYVAAAYRGEQMVGATVAFFGPPNTRSLHSHVTGVLPDGQIRGVGFALKTHQRAWALDIGVRTIGWTFDPLVSRNAHFNLAKLGARGRVYLESFYGDMPDELNAGDESDRLLVEWDLADPTVARALDGNPAERAPEALVALDIAGDERPVPGEIKGRYVEVRIPSDIYAVRKARPETALRWRLAVRDVLGGLLADGAVITGFSREGGYLLDRGEDA
ncbi:GNAT family N-acetyltransferase [Kutzneria kofuensis]|uniref:Putative GNAT superfamily acetyltransferase n=1 Tax=Kutzneria kofuensis TaxID=103725 RepID=A0A7W9NM71_9PSEU|nr:GNAT family N-acetyltransferase [Kutzneria kofuensis]MBB5897534.1 putative GNAT superfamily acetyltransferase [Kutzneria kofuensis]